MTCLKYQCLLWKKQHARLPHTKAHWRKRITSHKKTCKICANKK